MKHHLLKNLIASLIVWYKVYFLFVDLSILIGKKRRPLNQTNQNNMFLQVLELHPEILQQILSTVLNVIMFEDCRNQWSMSRPLLGLILLNEEVSFNIKKKTYL